MPRGGGFITKLLPLGNRVRRNEFFFSFFFFLFFFFKISGHFAKLKKKKPPSNFLSIIMKWGVLKKWFCCIDRTVRVSIYIYIYIYSDLAPRSARKSHHTFLPRQGLLSPFSIFSMPILFIPISQEREREKRRRHLQLFFFLSFPPPFCCCDELTIGSLPCRLLLPMPSAAMIQKSPT